jgi:ankyrin repeat protein
LELVKLLLKHGADCTAQDNRPIRVASYNGNLEVVQLLLEHGKYSVSYKDEMIQETKSNRLISLTMYAG